MNMHVTPPTPTMAELRVSNDLLGDRDALEKAWERDGYWFFRDVLDKDVIARIRRVYVDYLVDMGLTDPADAQARYNGADYTHLPINSNISKLNEAKAHKILHESAAVNAFFRTLFGTDPFWVPFTVHRTNPPVTDRARSRFDFIHADGFYNEGLPFLICWVPIDVIDEQVGGLALVEGVHREPSLHKRVDMKIMPIQLEDVPADKWRRTTYRPGDVLIMSLDTPHSGLSNVSRDRFRFSMDTRVMPMGDSVPAVGTIVRVSETSVTVADGTGEHSFVIDEHSFVRGHRGDQMPPADIPARYSPGDDVIVMDKDGHVLNMRPQH